MQRRTKDTGRGELLGSEFCCLISLRVRCTRTPEGGYICYVPLFVDYLLNKGCRRCKFYPELTIDLISVSLMYSSYVLVFHHLLK